MHSSGHMVLITGGSSGIGAALAQIFMQHGNQVCVTGRDAAKLERLRAQLPGITTYVADMTKPADLQQLATDCRDVTILINNAAVQHNFELLDQSVAPEQISAEIATNLSGPILLTKLLLPSMRSKPAAAIINISSGLALVPKQAAPVYCATKAGLHSFSTTLRWQLEAHNIAVFEVLPPLVDTPMTAGRGRAKITPAALAQEFWRAFERDQYVVPIGKTKLLLWLSRWLPRRAERIMRHGL